MNRVEAIPVILRGNFRQLCRVSCFARKPSYKLPYIFFQEFVKTHGFRYYIGKYANKNPVDENIHRIKIIESLDPAYMNGLAPAA